MNMNLLGFALSILWLTALGSQAGITAGPVQAGKVEAALFQSASCPVPPDPPPTE